MHTIPKIYIYIYTYILHTHTRTHTHTHTHTHTDDTDNQKETKLLVFANKAPPAETIKVSGVEQWVQSDFFSFHRWRANADVVLTGSEYQESKLRAWTIAIFCAPHLWCRGNGTGWGHRWLLKVVTNCANHTTTGVAGGASNFRSPQWRSVRSRPQACLG